MSIRKKIWAGFGIVLLIFILQGSNSLSGLSTVHEKFVRVADEAQPAAILSLELEIAIESVSNSLGQFLLTKEKEKKDQYILQLKKLIETVGLLHDLSAIKNDKKSVILVRKINQGVNQFSAYQNQMIELSENDNINILAMGYASENINPLNQTQLQLVSQMLLSEEEGFTNERVEFFRNLYQLRYRWSSVMNDVRLYLLAGRSSEAAKEIKGLIKTSGLNVKKGTALVTQSGSALQQIVTEVENVSKLIRNVAQGTEQQSEGIEQVNIAISKMENTSQQNAALVEQVAASSSSIDDQSREVTQSLGFFKTNDQA